MFEDKVIAVTGTMKSMTRKKALALIESLGAHPTNHVTRRTDFLVVGSLDELEPTEKKIAAIKLIDEGAKVQMITEELFLSLVK